MVMGIERGGFRPFAVPVPDFDAIYLKINNFLSKMNTVRGRATAAFVTVRSTRSKSPTQMGIGPGGFKGKVDSSAPYMYAAAIQL